MLGEPHAFEALLLGVGNLLQGFVDALGFTGWGPGFGNLNLVEQANSHGLSPVKCRELPDAAYTQKRSAYPARGAGKVPRPSTPSRVRGYAHDADRIVFRRVERSPGEIDTVRRFPAPPLPQARLLR